MAGANEKSKKFADINIHLGPPVREKELVVFVRQFATMIDAGLPLVQCLEILAARGTNPRFAEILSHIKSGVEQGGTFSEALRRHPRVFDDLFVNLVQAGEMGGVLDTIMNRLATYIEKRVKLRAQVRRALVYPSVVVVVALGVLTILLGWVIPAFGEMFADFGSNQPLPALTVFVMTMSNWFVGNFLFIVIVLVVIVSSLIYSRRTPRGRRVWDEILLRVPVVGPVMAKIAVARFTRTLGTLLSSGVPILDAMNVVARASGNVVVSDAIQRTADGIRQGRNIADPLAETTVFPPVVVQMIGVGEQTGALDQMLNKIADFYEDDVDMAVGALTSLLEPMLIVVVGSMVAVILLAMYLPIFDMAGAIQVS